MSDACARRGEDAPYRLNKASRHNSHPANQARQRAETEDILPVGPAILATWLSPWTKHRTGLGVMRPVTKPGVCTTPGVCDHAGFHMVRDLLQLATWTSVVCALRCKRILSASQERTAKPRRRFGASTSTPPSDRAGPGDRLRKRSGERPDHSQIHLGSCARRPPAGPPAS